MHKEKALQTVRIRLICKALFLRREGDSNPRYAFGVYTLSRNVFPGCDTSTNTMLKK